jgi:hypothetical protein
MGDPIMFARLLRRLPARRPARRTQRNFSIEALEGRELLSLAAPFLVDKGRDLFPTNAYRTAPVVATSSNGSSVFVWQQAPSPGGATEVLAQRYNAAGNPVGSRVVIATSHVAYSGVPSVAMDAAGDFVVAWTVADSSTDTNVLAQKFNAAGLPVSALVSVAIGTFQEGEPAVAMSATGSFVVAYTRWSNGGDIFAKQYDTHGNLQNVVTVAATSAVEQSPSIAMTPDGRFDVAYLLSVGTMQPQDIIVNRYSASGGLLGISGVGPFATGTLIWSAPIAMDNTGDAMLAYSKRDPKNENDIDTEARRVSPAGAIGPEIQVASAPLTAGPETPSGVALQPNGGPGGSFAVSIELPGFSGGTAIYNGYVAVVDASNTVSRLYGFGIVGYQSSITANSASGFLLAYTSPQGFNGQTHLYGPHVYGQRGTYV